MIIKKQRKNEDNRYGRYFLSTEAPGDENEEQVQQPAPKRNTKVIDVKPTNRARIDFTDGAEETPEEVIDAQPEETQNDVDFTDGAEGEMNTPDDAIQEPEPVHQDTNNEVDFTQDATEQPTDVPEETEAPGNGDGTVIDTDPVGEEDGEDFTAGAEEVQGDGTQEQPTEGDQTAGTQQGDKKGPGLEYDSTRKYILFKNFVSLINAVDNYITKLENSMTDNMQRNKILRNATEKLREIRELAYDYIVMKFEISTYIQSLLFFQKLVAMIQLVFNLLGKINKNNNTNKKK